MGQCQVQGCNIWYTKDDVTSLGFCVNGQNYMCSAHRAEHQRAQMAINQIAQTAHEQKTGTIYDQNYDSSEKQKDAICHYMSEVIMSNSTCCSYISSIAKVRSDTYGGKAGTFGYIFTNDHPSLIMTFIHHVCKTLWGKQTCEGNIVSFDINFNRGFYIDVNAKRFSCNRSSISLLEVLEMYKCVRDKKQMFPLLNGKERRDGKYAWNALLSGDIFKRRLPNNQAPNQYCAMIKELI